VFGAATAAALVAGLDASQLADAFGIAGSQAAGSLEFLADGSWTKRFHPGWAACAGLHAAALAAAGFRAPHTIFEGRFGTLHGYSDGAATGPLAGRDGGELLRTSIKPHACCRYAQGPIDAVLELRRRGVNAGSLTRLDVGLVSAGFPIVCEPIQAKRRPQSVVDAQFSLPFSVAVALVTGAASPDEFVPTRFADPEIHRVMDVVEPHHDAGLDARYPDVWPVWVRATTRDGRVHEARVDHPRGDPENFPTHDELRSKFRRLAGRTLDAAAIARLEPAIDAFARAPRVADLLALAEAPGK
jgi:2-methylcitrate dehydratase PrpD